ncbi:mitochondrial protein import protein ZIM17 [Gastrolobium bilobum]|uniref:mitochondrial protein import protein ZIM17 n=1 Tax=Gastrolobium bilobum TaxID=150636 RepID=UPI002AB10C28|nr:mitochondrial protein import protein ZIM17 [Gastrolobium bilobum]
MAAGTVYSVPLFLATVSSLTNKNPQRIHSIFNLSPPISAIKQNPPSIRIPWSRYSGAAVVAPRLARRVFRVNVLVDDDSVTAPEPESDSSEAGASIDLCLPRRSLLVQFTCNLCGERTKRLVNRLAYERGAIFVQCAGCLRHHKLVDNLGLVTEHDFREKMNMDSEIDQV